MSEQIKTTSRGPAPTARIPVPDGTTHPRIWFWQGAMIDWRKAKRITRKVWAGLSTKRDDGTSKAECRKP